MTNQDVPQIGKQRNSRINEVLDPRNIQKASEPIRNSLSKIGEEVGEDLPDSTEESTDQLEDSNNNPADRFKNCCE